jgi:phosphinothricin acetyltransferase
MTHVRDANHDDLGAIFDIYHEQVLHATATFDTEPKTQAQQHEWFDAHDRSLYPVLVATRREQSTDRVLGWARLYPWSPRRAYLRTAENAVYVHACARGQGIGRMLLLELLARARAGPIREVMARIADANPASIRLHEAMGYVPVGVMHRAGEKFGRLIDVHLYQKSLG